MAFEVVGPKGNLEEKFVGVDIAGKFPNKKKCAYLIVKDKNNGNKYCIIGGIKKIDREGYCVVAIGVLDKEDNCYHISNNDLEIIPVCEEIESKEKIEWYRNMVNAFLKYISIKCGHLDNYEELLTETHNWLHNKINNHFISHIPYHLLNARFKYVAPFNIPYLKEDIGFNYQEGAVFVCRGFTKENEDNIKLKMVIETGTYVLYVDPLVLYEKFEMIDEKGKHLFR